MNFSNKEYIVGSDEVGYGSACSSLVVCGVRAHKDWTLAGLNDSKKLTPNKRERLSAQLLKLAQENVISYYIAERSNIEIDEIGLGKCLKSAYIEIFQQLYQPDSLIITDGILKFDNENIRGYDQVSVIKADTKFPTVMAASIIAKVYRDNKLTLLHNEYPEYGWNSNKGYLSSGHIAAIKQYGFTPYHRLSYKIKNINK